MSRWTLLAGLLLGTACASTPRAHAHPSASATVDAPKHHRVEPQPPARFTDPLRLPKLWLAIPELERIVSETMEEHAIPGLALALVIDDRTAWSIGLGVRDLETRAPVTTTSVFGIGSLTKAITALAVLRLRDAGKLDLDASALEYLPELAGIALPGRHSQPPTLRELLTHTSGLPRLGDFTYSSPPHEPTAAEILQSFADFAMWHEPGSEHLYSNLGYQVLGLVLERVGGEPQREHISQQILAPLGIAAAWWDHASVPAELRTVPYAIERGEIVAKSAWRQGAAGAAGGLLLGVDELAKLARFELAAWAEPDGPGDPLARSSVRESHLGVLTDLSATSDADSLRATATGYGFGWGVHRECTGERVVSHTGGTEGYASAISMLPDHGVALVLLSNLAGWPRDATMRRLIAALRRTGGLVAREPVPALQLVHAALRYAELLAEWNEAAYLEHWSPHDRARDRIDQNRRMRDAIAKMAGRCGPPTIVKTVRPFVGDVDLACEGADVHLRLSALPAGRGKILAVSATLVGAAPAAELVHAAESVVALLTTWDDAAFVAAFAPALQLAPMRRSLRDDSRRWGRCHLGDITEVTPDGASWQLDCERATAVLTLRSDRDDHRITAFEIDAKDPSRRSCK